MDDISFDRSHHPAPDPLAVAAFRVGADGVAVAVRNALADGVAVLIGRLTTSGMRRSLGAARLRSGAVSFAGR
ncbi:hypothetical protein [Nocardia sp. NPDC051463]|uniref:hypothetical protein n=1 Tax=Nocardia sp. NPDC051463 TaxID=3154845 RepID=UPI003414F2D5